MPKILIIEDNTELSFMLASYLKREKYKVEEASNGGNGLRLIQKNKFDLVFCDYRLPDYDGTDLLKDINKLDPELGVVIMTAYADVKTAIQCMKLGALDYITKPIHHQELLLLTKKFTGKEKKKKGKKVATKKEEGKYVWGKSPQSRQLVKNIELVAPTDMTVILQGESGTGKEYAASAIHEKSKRGGKPFQAIDCGALTEELAGSELFGHIKGAFTGAVQDKTGQFEAANGGTLFLDEIGNLSYENQVKLLRVLQERKVRKVGSTKDINIDVRLIVASNEDLQEAVKNGKFRGDLYHRLNEFTIEIDPLRQRREDIDIYISHFLQQANEELGKEVKKIDEPTKTKLLNYQWHGNLRELRNVLKRAVLLATNDTISMECVPAEIVYGTGTGSDTPDAEPGAQTLKAVVSKAEKQAIMKTLKKTAFNKSKAARILEIDRKTLYNKIREYDLE